MNDELKNILEKHEKWICGLIGGEHADLRDADLRDANLHEAKNLPFIPVSCPDSGSFTAWKKHTDIL